MKLRVKVFAALTSVLWTLPALAAATVNISNIQVPTTGTLVPFSFAYDGTNKWNFVLPYDGTTIGAVNADTGLVVHVQNTATVNLGTIGVAATAANQTAVQAATGASVPASAQLIGGRSQNAEATPHANGQLTPPALDLVGKVITSPYANKENMLRGTASATGTSATTLIAAQSGLSIYVTGVQCKNTSTTVSTIVTLNDTETTGSGTALIVPANNGDNETYVTPLVVSASTALTFTATAGATTIYCNAQGYAGS